MKYGKSAISIGRVGNKILSIVKYGKYLVWQLGNFLTKEGLTFITADNKVFEVKENK